MMRLTTVAALFADLDEAEISTWVARGWITPETDDGDPAFLEIDIARVRLIHDLRSIMHIEDDAVPVVLALLDQVYDLRGSLHAVLHAIRAQPAPVRDAIRAALDPGATG